MRLFLVAASVLGLSLGGAYAQGVSFKGDAGMGVKYTAPMKDDGVTKKESMIEWKSFFKVAMSASGTTDGGLQFGASAKIEANGAGDGKVAKSNAFIGGESWKVAIGNLDPASDKGKSIGDVGFDGDLGVDNVAEFIGGTKADVEVSFSLGAASLAITAGQTGGSDRVPAVTGMPKITSFYKVGALGQMTKLFDIENDGTASFNNNTPNDTADDYMLYQAADGQLWKVVGERDATPGIGEGRTDTDDDGDLSDEDAHTASDDTVATTGEIGNATALATSERVASQVTQEFVAAKAVVPAKGQKTQWAAGASFDIGSTTLGIGIDSEKLMQASVSADLGAFNGSLFYARQKSDDGNTKKTGIGAEIGVSAGANTDINVVYAQGKTEMGSMSDTDKGFGVGVNHGLGGGATLQAGFAKVRKQAAASVGVTMSF